MSKKLRDNFDVRIKQPLDKRMSVNNLNEIDRPYEGLIAFQKTDGKHYKYINGTFKIFGSSVDLSGKKYVYMGDSITYGYVPKPYGDIVSEYFNMEKVNMGVSGSSFCIENGKTDSIYERRLLIPSDADILTIMGGTNDFYHAVADLGYNYNTSPSQGLYGTLNALCSWLMDNMIHTKIIFLTPTPRSNQITENSYGYVLEDVAYIIKDVCAFWSIPVIDLFKNFGYSPYSTNVKTEYMTDGVHPLQSGHELIADQIIKYLGGK